MADIIITIPDDQFDEFKLGVLRAAPIPTDENDLPLFTEADWFEQLAKENYREIFISGKTLLAKDDAPEPVVNDTDVFGPTVSDIILLL